MTTTTLKKLTKIANVYSTTMGRKVDAMQMAHMGSEWLEEAYNTAVWVTEDAAPAEWLQELVADAVGSEFDFGNQ
jgi:hypothetical protein